MVVMGCLRFLLARRLIVVCFMFVGAAMGLLAGDGHDVATVPPALTNNAPTNNPLWLWIDVPTNAARTNWSGHGEMTATNLWLPPGRDNLIATASTWRTSAFIETGYFHADPRCWSGDSRPDRRSEDGWYQAVGVEMDHDLDHGDSGMSVGIGVSVGRAFLRGP